METEDNIVFTDGMKDKAYRKDLVPLKLRISQILLYDTETALLFLQEYNEIIKNGFDSNMYNRICDLEVKMNEYENSQGKEKMYDEESRTIIEQIEDLQIHYKQLPLEEFEQQMKEISNVYYNNSIKYSYEKKETIESQINALQAKLIMQKADMATTYDMKQMITENNKNGLIMYVYSELSKLVQSDNSALKRIANQLKTMTANGEDFIYDPRTWKLLDSAQRNMITKNEEQAQAIVNLPAVQKKKANYSFLDKIFGTKIKIGDKEMKVKKTIQLGMDEIRTKDLAKIDMNWLASKVSKEMLEEIEMKKLKEEGRNLAEKYVPDVKTPIYNFFIDDSKHYSWKKKITYFNEQGTEVYIDLDLYTSEIKIYIAKEIELPTIHVMEHYKTLRSTMKIITYAKFIDDIIGSNLKQELKNELGVFFENTSMNKRKEDKTCWVNEDEMLKIMDKLPIYSSLLKSYENVQKECEETKLNFRWEENLKRENFYKQSEFRNNLVKNNKRAEDRNPQAKNPQNPINREGETPSNFGDRDVK